jgi:hypothetical protein
MVNIRKALNSKKVRTFHRWIGIAVALYVVMATISGSIHIIMTNFYSPPPPVMPQGLVNVDKASLPLAEIVKIIPAGAQVKAINIRTIDNDLWYQVVTAGSKPYYINATSGRPYENMDESYAKQIATSYLKTQEGLVKTDYITEFNSEYLNIFRALPVYRFDVENSNGERAYVSTITGSVTLYLNGPRAFGQKSFSYLHKLSFIPNKLVRDILMAVLVASVLITTLIGVGMFFARKKK